MKSIIGKLLRENSQRVGENIVLYLEADRKVYFFHHGENGYELRLIRGKRKMPIKVRQTDILVKYTQDGEVVKNHNIPSSELERIEA